MNTFEIDFLPAEYRLKQLQQRRRVQRVLVLGLAVAILAAAWASQNYERAHVQQELATLATAHEAATAQNKELAELQAKLDTARATAELYTYLRHPWPRTQLLWQLASALPASVTLHEVRIAKDSPQTSDATERLSPAEKQAEEKRLASVPAATRDLKALRKATDRANTTIALTGVTSNIAELHAYLGALGKSDVVTKANLLTLESETGGQSERLRFRAMLVVKPGYGQPGGPEPPKSNALSQAATTGSKGNGP